VKEEWTTAYEDMSLYGYEDYSWQGQHLGTKIGETKIHVTSSFFPVKIGVNSAGYMMLYGIPHFQTHPCSAINMDWPLQWRCA